MDKSFDLAFCVFVLYVLCVLLQMVLGIYLYINIDTPESWLFFDAISNLRR